MEMETSKKKKKKELLEYFVFFKTILQKEFSTK